MRKFLLTSAAIGTLVLAGQAHATITSITSPATLNLVNFGTAPTGFVSTTIPSMGGLTFTSSGGTTGLYAGTGGTSPTGFTSPFGASQQEYIAVQPGGSVTITFATPQTTFSALLGTIDSYNGLTFAVSGDTVTGTQIATALGISANGSTTRNVSITDSVAFTSVTLTDTAFSAFEFDPAAITTTVPEPMSLALLGTGLVGVAMTRRRKATGLAG